WLVPFYLFAVLGVVWAGVWYWYYRGSPAEHSGPSGGGRQMIQSALWVAPKRKAIPWGAILSSPQMWIVAGMYFCYGYAINMFLTWFPKYLNTAHGYSLAQVGFLASLTLAAGVIGDIAGGWFSDKIIEHTGRIKFARQVVAIIGFLIAAVCIPLALQSEG